MDATKARAALNCIRSTCDGPRVMVLARCRRCLSSTRRGDADAPAVVANVASMPSTSVAYKAAFLARFGAARRHVSRTRHPRRPPAPNRRPRAVGIGRVVTAEDGTGLRIAKKCARTRPAADRPGSAVSRPLARGNTRGHVRGRVGVKSGVRGGKWSPRAFPRAAARAQELRVAEFPFLYFPIHRASMHVYGDVKLK